MPRSVVGAQAGRVGSGAEPDSVLVAVALGFDRLDNPEVTLLALVDQFHVVAHGKPLPAVKVDVSDHRDAQLPMERP